MLDLENSQIDYPEKIAQDRIDLEVAKKAGDSAKVLDLERGITIYEKMLEEKRFQWDNIMDGNWAAISEWQFERLNNFVQTSKSQNFIMHINYGSTSFDVYNEGISRREKASGGYRG